ncbi:MAG: hypothetical protein ACE366_28575 [Bradymonadia bacterium]
MADWNQLADELSTNADLKSLTFEQGQSIIDLLAFIVHADDRVAFLEKTQLEHMLLEMPWAEGKHDEVDAYLEDAVKRAGGDDWLGGLKTVSQRVALAVTSIKGREKVYEMAATLAAADFEYTDEERKALGILGDALEIGADIRSAIERDAGL